MVEKKKDSCAGKGSAVGQLNKSNVLFHVVFLAAPLHTLYVAFLLPIMDFFFYFCGIRGKNPTLARVWTENSFTGAPTAAFDTS